MDAECLRCVPRGRLAPYVEGRLRPGQLEAEAAETAAEEVPATLVEAAHAFDRLLVTGERGDPRVLDGTEIEPYLDGGFERHLSKFLRGRPYWDE